MYQYVFYYKHVFVYGVYTVHVLVSLQEYVFVSSDLQRVMPDDSKISSHPIIVPVDHPSEITEVFDSISYSKVMMMFNNSTLFQ